MCRNERDACILRARFPEYCQRVARSQRLIAEALERLGNPYIAFSTGKDSTVVLHLVRGIRPDTIAIYGDDEWLLPESESLLSETPNVRRIKMRVQHADWFIAWNGEDCAEPSPTWAADMGFDGVFLGLRTEENVRRKLLIRQRGATFYVERRKMWLCNPIAAWTTQDVWTYILSNEISYNRAYDVLQRIGVPLDQQRIGPLANERVLGRGQLALLKRGWPDLFNRFAATHPEARAYV